MRSTFRLLANVKAARYLEPFAPTGLTGLATHPSPRPTLIHLYKTTLENLKSFPESSVYRQSTEALTRHRLQIIESVKPPGYEAWLERVKKAVAAEPERFASLRLADGTYAGSMRDDGSDNPRGEEWNGEALEATTEGPARTTEQEERWHKVIEDATTVERKDADFAVEQMKWENEPALEAEQVSEIEKQIGAGLIEEVIQVAEGELKLVQEMYKSKVWEELEEKPRPGQWVYFDRIPPAAP
ncbi:complex I NDUFA5 subunit family protein [Aspergillus clavatus NRRL 1]|uniref:NADH-ubiquinone oxidoreductase 299 kDa subunit, putative n=1 Tax=Aspergillus clavatus (strain ATCC 1007 / CBS 513.65 / DSM 816 / NCTC 3887 / NRRL 1 / QM 1276 / 107) TaxID=344612 RepID=A1C6A9_ASPCL|nr:NADH-ubiquinone oxidoreductase 299 kDa subunit, putative [Aspergillus clavatus NRRL 1]EAW13930.1 NADH-ubiquinone oxidoreductase 299 kDa subunit, putative [Aspergillus clavatus NRRL 1]